MHNRSMKMLASLAVDGIMTEAEHKEVVQGLFALQKRDGGRNLATLGANWRRADGTPQDYETSDGYGTGFVIYALRAAGVPADVPPIQRGSSGSRRINDPAGVGSPARWTRTAGTTSPTPARRTPSLPWRHVARLGPTKTPHNLGKIEHGCLLAIRCRNPTLVRRASGIGEYPQVR